MVITTRPQMNIVTRMFRLHVVRGRAVGGDCSGGKQQSIKEFFKRGVCNLKEILAVCALA